RRAMQARVLRRVAAADDHGPVVLADADRLAVLDPAVAVGQAVDALAKAAEARAVVLERVLVPARAPIELDAVLGCLAPGVGHEHAAREVLEPRHPQPAVELAREPAGH